MQRIEPRVWSWLFWWEANRDQYIWSRQSAAGVFNDEAYQRRARDDAFAALSRATQSELAPVRATAAIALGRMGEARAIEPVKPLLRDQALATRRAAMIALAIIDTRPARQLLSDRTKGMGRWPLDDQLAAIAALALLQQPDDGTLRLLRNVAESNHLSQARFAARALRHRNDREAGRDMLGQLHRNKDPWIASDAMVMLGHFGRQQAAPILPTVLQAADAEHEVAAWKALQVQHKRRDRLIATIKTATNLNVQRQHYRQYLELVRS